MSAALVPKLHSRGILVSRAGTDLVVRAVAKTLTEATLDFLGTHKAKILAELTPPPAPPLGSSSAVAAAVEARVDLLRSFGLPPVEAERQAVEELLRLDDAEAHGNASCDLHGLVQRRVPRSSIYRCPACLPGVFGRREYQGSEEEVG